MDSKDIERQRIMFDDFANEEDGVEFWYARDLMKPLGYTQWRRFEDAVKRAMASCESNKVPVERHFAKVGKSSAMPNGGTRTITDYMLTRYACYLIAMNGDPRKQEIAIAQAYFASQTRKQEMIEQRVAEIQRLQSREAYGETDRHLSAVVFERGVDSKGLATIKSQGDRALFGGNDTRAMKRRLGVPARTPLANFLPEVTINAKALANSMTAYNVEQRDLHGIVPIGSEHVDNNRSIRSTLLERGIVPERLPAEEDTKSLKMRIESDERRIRASEDGFKLDEG